MAMARPMGRPSSPPIALIATVVLLVIAVGIAVMFYLQQSTANDQVVDFKKKADVANRERDAALDAFVEAARKLNPNSSREVTGQTIGGIRNYLNEAMESIPNRVLNGAPGSAPFATQSDPNKALSEKAFFEQNKDLNNTLRVKEDKKAQLTPEEKQIRDFYRENSYGGRPLLASLAADAADRQKFYENWQDDKKKIDDAKNETAQVRKDVDRLQGELKVIGDDAAKKRAEIEANSKTALAAKDVEIASARKETDDVKKKLTDMQIKSLNDLTEKDIQIDKLKVTIAELNRKLIALNSTGALVKTATGLPSKLPDGSVAQVFPDMNLVYLRLTRPQQAKLGMRYVIFSKDKPVPDTGEGKAVVEISSLEGGSIQGKIIKSTASDPMVPGDPALNLVVGPRKYSFVVYGNFDLRNDGVFEPSGKSQIEGLITRWGGTVQQDMDMTTNFLILGVQTEVPPKPAENADAVTRENYEKKLDENKKWAELYDRAARQTIPAMNTNTFLHFIGFFNDDLGPGWEKRVRPGDDYLPSK